MTDAVYTEQVILELIDKTGASMDVITARFKAQAGELKALGTSAGAAYSEQLAARTADIGTFWDFYIVRAKLASAEEKEIARELWNYRKEGMAEEAAAEAEAAKARVLADKLASAEEKEIARELFTYRKEAIAEELRITKQMRAAALAEERAAAQEHKAFMAKPSGAAGLTGGMGTNAVIGTALVGFEAIEGAKKYNDALRDMGTLLTDAGTSNYAFNVNLRETGALAREFSSRFNIDVVDVLKSFKEALSSGFDQGDLAKVGEVGAEMSRAMHVSMQESVDVLATVRNAWKLSVDDMQGAGDRLFNMVNYGRIRMEEIRSSFGRVSAAAAAAGLSFQDVAASLIVLTKDGQTNSQAVTALAAAINRVDTASDGLKHKFELAGIAAQDLDFHTHTLTSVIEKLRDVTHGSAEILHDLFPEAREYRGVIDLINHIDELKAAETGAAETGTLLIAANRNLDNGFDRLGGTAKGVWNGITSSISTALDKYYEWSDALRTGGAGREAEGSMKDFGKQQFERYGDLFASSAKTRHKDSQFSTAEDSLETRRDALSSGSMSMDDVAKTQANFNRRIAEEEGFAARVKAMDDFRLKGQRAITDAAAEEKQIKVDLLANDRAMGEAAEQREKTQKAMEAMEKKGGIAKAFPGFKGKAHDAADEALAWLGLPDVQEIEDSVKHMREVGKKEIEEQHKLAKEARAHLMHDAKHKREEHEKEEKGIEREVTSAFVEELRAREEELKKFNTHKLEEIKRVKDEEARVDRQMADMENRLNEEVFETKMKQKGGGGKHVDADAQARFARTQLEEIEQKLRDASGPRSKVSENDFKNMIGEYEKISRAKEGANDRAGNGDRGIRQRLDEESTEQGFISAFRKMNHGSATSQVDGINGRVFKGKSEAEMAKDAAKKVEEKHITEVNAKIDFNVVGLTTDSLQAQIKTTVTKVLADISSRGTGVTGRPSLDRGPGADASNP